jgi:hypothetical protein
MVCLEYIENCRGLCADAVVFAVLTLRQCSGSALLSARIRIQGLVDIRERLDHFLVFYFNIVKHIHLQTGVGCGMAQTCGRHRNCRKESLLVQDHHQLFMCIALSSVYIIGHCVQLSDESMEVFVSELKKISAADAEGEAGVYFTAALTLKDTILNLRYSL